MGLFISDAKIDKIYQIKKYFQNKFYLQVKQMLDSGNEPTILRVDLYKRRMPISV